MKRIGFYLSRPFHHAMLRPIYELLKGDTACCWTADLEQLVSFKPDIAVVADHYRGYLWDRLPDVQVVWTRHGFSSKNYLRSAIQWCDYACVSSDWVRHDLLAKRWLPRKDIWTTGFTPMDEVYRRNRDMRHSGDYKTLLYAPTFNPLLASPPRMRGNWTTQLLKRHPQLQIVIKDHPHSFRQNPDWIKQWRDWASKSERVRFLDEPDADIYPLLAETDILFTDASSVMFYYLALDRPIILFDNPLRPSDPRFEPEAPEWAWRDMGTAVSNEKQLPGAVDKSLANPGQLSAQRNKYRERVLGDLFDGKAAQRVATHIKMLPG